MDLFEHQAKELFAKYGVAVPRGKVAWSPEEAEAAAAEVGGTVVVKAQVQIGGRGKAGGIKLAKDPAEARQQAERILGMDSAATHRPAGPGRAGLRDRRQYYVAILHDRAARASWPWPRPRAVETSSSPGDTPSDSSGAGQPAGRVRSYHVTSSSSAASDRARRAAAQSWPGCNEVSWPPTVMLSRSNPLADRRRPVIASTAGLPRDLPLERHPDLRTARHLRRRPPRAGGQGQASTTSSWTATSASSATALAWS